MQDILIQCHVAGMPAHIHHTTLSYNLVLMHSWYNYSIYKSQLECYHIE